MAVVNAAWQHGGYCGRGPVGGLLDSLRGRPALVCGGAESVFEDYRAAAGLVNDPVIFAANDIGAYLPEVHHMVSLHADKLIHWAAIRKIDSWLWKDCKTHSARTQPGIDYPWEALTPVFALSGYFAMQIAYLMGCEPIVLCGCPGDSSRRFFDLDPRKDFTYADKVVTEELVNEMARLPEFKARVRSMSGWTREFFGGI